MLWAALLLDPASCPSLPDAQRGLATWCLQFTPRVALVEDAVAIELEASTRLFGGRRRLAQRITEESAALGVARIAWAPTSLAALALVRAGRVNGFARPLAELLDALPLETLSATHAHAPVLARLGCNTLGQLRALPRGGVSRRFGGELLVALDRAYGLREEAHEWVPVPDRFQARLELMHRVELAPALLFGAHRLLLQMGGWLAARRAGVTAFTLRWCHDVMRARNVGEVGEITIRTAETTRNVEHLSRLLAEHLAKVQLDAPVGDLELVATEVQALEEHSGALLPDTRQQGESLALVLERIAARLGPERVLRPVLQEDHRMEWMVHWQPAPEPLPRRPVECDDLPQPTFLLPEPLKLAVRGNRPQYQGPLLLLSGPHRVEGGWWHRLQVGQEARAQTVVRDYWVALSEHAGVLWVYQSRLASDHTAWYLHGVFA